MKKSPGIKGLKSHGCPTDELLVHAAGAKNIPDVRIAQTL
jgi:hypothetical protein